jgi:predicted DCC family thiol-disulfide oxidoreductase YuxK
MMGSVAFVVIQSNLSLITKKMRNFFFCPLQSDFAKVLLSKQGVKIDLDTIYVYSMGVVYSKSAAIQVASRHFKLPFYFISVLIGFTPKILADSCYTFFANHRYDIQGKVEQCLLPTPAQRKRFLNLE